MVRPPTASLSHLSELGLQVGRGGASNGFQLQLDARFNTSVEGQQRTGQVESKLVDGPGGSVLEH